jgi:hypothetical protein
MSTFDLRFLIQMKQQEHQMEIQAWNKDRELTQEQGLWLRSGCLVIPPDEHLREEVLHLTHDHPTAGHSRVLKTLQITVCLLQFL